MLRLALLTTDNREDRRDYTPARPWFGTAVQALLDGFASMPDEIEVHIVSSTRAHLETPLKLAPNIHFYSVHVPPWSWMKSAYLGNILAVRKCLSVIRPDLVHGHGTERDCALSAVFSGYPNLITLHGNMRRLAMLANASLFSFAGLTSILESIAISMTGGVVCLSTHTLNLVSPTSKSTWIIPNAVDPTFLLPQEETETIPPEILIIGDLLPNKNQLAFLKAIAPLQQELGFTVQLIGKCQKDQPYTSEILHFATSQPWCEYAEFLNHKSLAQRLARATLLAVPSLEENLPMVILEAMAAGLPVAASNVGGIPDLITHQETGILFDPNDPDSMQKSILAILADSTARHELIIRARKKILQHHLPESIARRHLAIYQEMLLR